MSGVRVYDLAKELKVSNTDLLEVLRDLGEPAKTASSTINETAADAVRRRLEGQSVAAANGAAAIPASKNGKSAEGASANGSSSVSEAVNDPKPPASIPAAEKTASVNAEEKSQPVESSVAVPTPPMAEPTPPVADAAPPAPSAAPVEESKKVIIIPSVVSLKDFADLISVPPQDIQKKLMGLGVLASLNQKLSPEVTTRLAKSYGVSVTVAVAQAPKPIAPVVPGTVAAPAAPVIEAPPKVAVVAAKPRQKSVGPVARPPVVTIMGHVDHGKTTLLDVIRKSRVAASEHGGITQHIGAYQIDVDDPSTPGALRKITFLDTPGHEAFTAMRARGAQVTDIAVLVVAADDGVMPQTIEAINHAKAAGVPIIIAVNKIDKEGANPTRVLTQLTEYDVMPEAYGGTVQTVELSAKENLGVDDLLEKIILVADAEVEPKADPTAPATGTVIEAELDKGRGIVTTLLVDQGTVKMGDSIVAGATFGRIKAMTDDRGQRLQTAPPATPVVILGLNGVPNAGDRFEVVKDEKTARQIGELRASDERHEKLNTRRALTLEDMQKQIKEGEAKTLNIIVKGDVQGSVEAIRQSLEKINHDEVRVKFISTGIGPVSDSDVLLASASEAIITGFNVKADTAAQRLAEAEHVEIREYRVIYDLIDDVKKAMAGLLDPIYEESPLGTAEVRAVFKLPRSGGSIAGSYITDGKVVRNANVRVHRGGKVVHEGKIDTLKREKDDAKEVAQGYECGILIPNYDPQEGDKIECFEMKRIQRTL